MKKEKVAIRVNKNGRAYSYKENLGVPKSYL